MVTFSHSEIDLLAAGHADAFALLARLRKEHWDRPVFVLANAMAGSLGWTVRRFKAARNYLVECGRLRRVHPGGGGPHDPPKFELV